MDFESMSNAWDSIKTNNNRRTDSIEDGEYEMKVVGFDFYEIPKGTFYKWHLEVSSGMSAGSYVQKFQKTTDVGLSILARDFLLITGSKPQFSEIYNAELNAAGPASEKLMGKTLRVKKTTKGDYSNYEFHGVVEGNGVAEDNVPADDFMVPGDDFGEEIAF